METVKKDNHSQTKVILFVKRGKVERITVKQTNILIEVKKNKQKITLNINNL